ncbi:YihY/virulence factor BrkB family protein [Geotoga petraea]|jgi:membrane protein|uniref:YihY/virulence factor BrkB family protein n=1 Tax=Geotoga petraea TaxID=28234 RepID=A0A4Z0W5T3_9BACT|nr:YihY/virulence factor BrkB family protein [Geotoga petraea]TGG88417.1 YihY/virulence factor BrkB family protein [Geotoga petraea]
MKNFLKSFEDNKFFDFVKNLYNKSREDDVGFIAGYISFFLLLSIFPFLIFFFNLLRYTPIANQDFIENILIEIPPETRDILETIINETINSSSQTLLSVSLIFSIWAGSNGITAIINSINKAYSIQKKLPYWKLKLISIVFTILLVLLIIVVLFTLVFGEIITNEIFNELQANGSFYSFWNVMRIIIPFVSMVLIFGLLYKFSISFNKRTNTKFIYTLPGSIFTTVGWIISSSIFSDYINNFNIFSTTYGSLGGIVISLIWIYIISLMIIIGAEINGCLHLNNN